jgi:hypothetical protein
MGVLSSSPVTVGPHDRIIAHRSTEDGRRNSLSIHLVVQRHSGVGDRMDNEIHERSQFCRRRVPREIKHVERKPLT